MSIFYKRILFVLCVSVVLTSHVHTGSADADFNLRPGSWSTSTTGKYYTPDGQVTPIPATTAILCISPEEAENGATKVLSNQEGCSVEVLMQDSSHSVMRLTCEDGTIQHHTMTWSSRSYKIDSHIKLTSQGHTVTTDLETNGEFIGACEKTKE